MNFSLKSLLHSSHPLDHFLNCILIPFGLLAQPDNFIEQNRALLIILRKHLLILRELLINEPPHLVHVIGGLILQLPNHSLEITIALLAHSKLLLHVQTKLVLETDLFFQGTDTGYDIFTGLTLLLQSLPEFNFQLGNMSQVLIVHIVLHGFLFLLELLELADLCQ